MKVFGFAGWSGSGKTTLIEQLIPRFVMQGLTVSLIKHAHHNFDIDRPGKDSYRHREAGCKEVMVGSAHRWVIMHELRGAREPTLEEQIARMAPCDLLLVEGFKFDPIPKLEIFRETNGKTPLYPKDPHIVGIATDRLFATQLPQFDLNDHDAIAEFVLVHLGLARTMTA